MEMNELPICRGGVGTLRIHDPEYDGASRQLSIRFDVDLADPEQHTIGQVRGKIHEAETDAVYAQYVTSYLVGDPKNAGVGRQSGHLVVIVPRAASGKDLTIHAVALIHLRGEAAAYCALRGASSFPVP